MDQINFTPKSVRISAIVIIGFGLLIALPGVFSGMFSDDYWHYYRIHETQAQENHSPLTPFNLFSLFQENKRQFAMDAGNIPWWTANNLKMVLYRPLSEITHYIDYTLFDTRTIPMHIHSMLWYSILLWLAFKFYLNIVSSHKVALLALAIFAAGPFHLFSVTWLANRNAIMAATFSLLCINLYNQYSNTTNIKFLLASLLSFIAGLLSSEIAMTALALIFFHIFINKKQSFIASIFQASPFILIFLTWLLGYKIAGYGASGGSSFYYNDPINSPYTYFHQLIQNIPRAFAMQITLISAFFRDYSNKWYAIYIGWICLAASAITLYHNKSRSLAFLFASSIAGIIPVSSSFFSERNYLFLAITLSPVIAMLINYLWQANNKSLKGAAIVVAILHIPVASIAGSGLSHLPKMLGKSSRVIAEKLPITINDKQLVLFGVPDMSVNSLYYIRYFEKATTPVSIWNITPETITATITRTSNNTFTISSNSRLLRHYEMLRSYKKEDPFRIGEKVQLHNAYVQITRLNNQGNPTRITLTFNRIDENSVAFYEWNNNKLEEFQLDVGESYHIQ